MVHTAEVFAVAIVEEVKDVFIGVISNI